MVQREDLFSGRAEGLSETWAPGLEAASMAGGSDMLLFSKEGWLNEGVTHTLLSLHP